MASDELEVQIQQEAAEIANAPKVPIAQFQTGSASRCSFCGRLSTNLVFVEVIHGQERYVGAECCRPSAEQSQ